MRLAAIRVGTVALLMAALALLAVNIFVFLQLRAPRPLTVSFLDVGNGDAVLVRGPTGVTVLIDGGPDASVLRALGDRLPFWHRHIDAVILSSHATSAVGGLLDVATRYRIGTVFLLPDQKEISRSESLFLEKITSSDIRHTASIAGIRFPIGGGAYAQVLAPPEGSADELLLRVVYGKTAFLFSGDLSSKIRAAVSRGSSDVVADVIAVPHQGAPDTVDTAWLAAVRPSVAVISVGTENRYDYPATTTLELLQTTHATVYQTSTDGEVTLASDGTRVWRK